jgi:hypothetical protein
MDHAAQRRSTTFGVLLLTPAKRGTGHYPLSKDVGKVTNNGKYLLEVESA